jgi:hypothetical protein
MTVEITITDPENWYYAIVGLRMFETAQYFSSATNFSIIDSYSSASTPNRYKGDPIANSVWTSGSDVANDNSWFVIECTTTLYPSLSLPNWQAKYQWTDTVGFDDVSGLDYDMETDTRVIALRFAAYGGWTLADTNPDFVGPSSQSSGSNKEVGCGGYGSGQIMRNIFYEDSGQFIHVVQNQFIGSDDKILTITTVMGDIEVIKTSAQTMPRVHINGYDDPVIDPPGSNRWICEDQYWSNTALTSWSSIELGIGYEAPDGITWVEEAFKTQTSDLVTNEFSQPTLHNTFFEMDTEPYLVCTYSNGPIGEIPGLGKIFGIGQNTFSSQSWLSMGGQTCMALKWDGSTNF